MGYLCANFGLPRPLCSRLRPDVRDRQTSERRALMPPTIRAGHNNSQHHVTQLSIYVLMKPIIKRRKGDYKTALTHYSTMRCGVYSAALSPLYSRARLLIPGPPNSHATQPCNGFLPVRYLCTGHPHTHSGTRSPLWCATTMQHQQCPGWGRAVINSFDDYRTAVSQCATGTPCDAQHAICIGLLTAQQ